MSGAHLYQIRSVKYRDGDFANCDTQNRLQICCLVPVLLVNSCIANGKIIIIIVIIIIIIFTISPEFGADTCLKTLKLSTKGPGEL